MNNAFQLNPQASDIDIQDAIDERLVKMEAVFNCLLAAREAKSELNSCVIYDVIWTICDFLDEVNLLRNWLVTR